MAPRTSLVLSLNMAPTLEVFGLSMKLAGNSDTFETADTPFTLQSSLTVPPAVAATFSDPGCTRTSTDFNGHLLFSLALVLAELHASSTLRAKSTASSGDREPASGVFFLPSASIGDAQGL